MLRSENLFAGNCTDVSVLQRQQAVLARHRQDQTMDFFVMPPFQTMFNDNSVYQQIANRSGNTDQYFGRIFPEIGDFRIVGTELTGDANCTVPLEWTSCTSPKMDRSFSLNSTCLTEGKVGVPVATENTAPIFGGRNSKKRKAEGMVAQDGEDEEIEEEARQEESEHTTKRNRETSTDNSKNSDIQKPDYIHLRAHRGQATDSHSLAERARREKVNKKMKYLQDLVPGCTKVTGKNGMLDEIINYVQSMQRQVEFLSMKLAAVNPRRNFHVDSFFMKEFPAHITSFPAAAASTENANLAYVQFSQSHQEAARCGIDMPISPTQHASQKTASPLVSIPKAFDSSCFPQAQSLSTWGTDLHALHNAEFH